MKIIQLLFILISFASVIDCTTQQKEHFIKSLDIIDEYPINIYYIVNGKLQQELTSDSLFVIYNPQHPRAIYKLSKELFITVMYMQPDKSMAFRKKMYNYNGIEERYFYDTIYIPTNSLEVSIMINPLYSERSDEIISTTGLDTTNINHILFYKVFRKRVDLQLPIIFKDKSIKYAIRWHTIKENFQKEEIKQISDSLLINCSNFFDFLTCLVGYSKIDDSLKLELLIKHFDKFLQNENFTLANIEIMIDALRNIANGHITQNSKVNLFKRLLSYFNKIETLQFHYKFIEYINKEILNTKNEYLVNHDDFKEYATILFERIKSLLQNRKFYVFPSVFSNFAIEFTEILNKTRCTIINEVYENFIKISNYYDNWPDKNDSIIYLFILVPKGLEGGLRSAYSKHLFNRGDSVKGLEILKDYMQDTSAFEATRSGFCWKILDYYFKKNDVDSIHKYLQSLYYFKHPIFFEYKKRFDSIISVRNLKEIYDIKFDIDYFYPQINTNFIISTNKGVIDFNADTLNIYFLFIIDENCPACNVGLINFVDYICDKRPENIKIIVFSILDYKNLSDIFNSCIILSKDIEVLRNKLNIVHKPGLIIIRNKRLIQNEMNIPIRLESYLNFFQE